MIKPWTLFVLCWVAAWPASALDMTIGSLTTCSMWTQERDKVTKRRGGDISITPTARAMTAWLIGFLEGYSWGCLSDPPLASGLDSSAVFERVDAICKSRPADTQLLSVAFDLVKELDPQHRDVCLH